MAENARQQPPLNTSPCLHAQKTLLEAGYIPHRVQTDTSHLPPYANISIHKVSSSGVSKPSQYRACHLNSHGRPEGLLFRPTMCNWICPIEKKREVSPVGLPDLFQGCARTSICATTVSDAMVAPRQWTPVELLGIAVGCRASAHSAQRLRSMQVAKIFHGNLAHL